MDTAIHVEGVEDLATAIDRMIEGVKPSKIEPVLSKAAGTVASEARKRAPVGPTGNLKKSVRKKKLVRSWETSAAYIVALDRRKAPHAWLVTHGTSGVRQVNPRTMRIWADRGAYHTDRIMPPNRFLTTPSTRSKPKS